MCLTKTPFISLPDALSQTPREHGHGIYIRDALHVSSVQIVHLSEIPYP